MILTFTKTKMCFITLLLASLLLHFACIKDKNELGPFQLEAAQETLYVNQKIKISSSKDDVEWTTNNTFICTIDKKGLLNTHHIGNCVVKAKHKNESKDLKIEVIPQITHFPEPIFQLEKNQATIEGLENRPLLKKSNAHLLYDTNLDYVNNLYYVFFNNKLTYAIVNYLNLSDEDRQDLYSFYLERYAYLGKRNNDYYFSNQSKKIAIAVSDEPNASVRYAKYEEI